MNDSNQAITTQRNSRAENSQGLERVSELMRTLAPVRAIGMNDDMASDWAAVIIAETAGMSDFEFLRGCENARRECSDHRQILKVILKGDPGLSEFKRNLKNHTRLAPKPKREVIAGPAARLIDDAVKGCRG